MRQPRFLPEEQKTINVACDAFKETYDDIMKASSLQDLPVPDGLKTFGLIYSKYLILQGAKKFAVELETEIEKEAQANGVTIRRKSNG